MKTFCMSKYYATLEHMLADKADHYQQLSMFLLDHLVALGEAYERAVNTFGCVQVMKLESIYETQEMHN